MGEYENPYLNHKWTKYAGDDELVHLRKKVKALEGELVLMKHAVPEAKAVQMKKLMPWKPLVFAYRPLRHSLALHWSTC